MEENHVRQVFVFVTHTQDIPDDWFKAIAEACRKAGVGSENMMEFVPLGQHYEEQHTTITRNHFFREIEEKADVYIAIVNQAWGETAGEEYQRARKRRDKGDLRVLLVGKRYKKGDDGYELANKTFESLFAELHLSKEEKNEKNGLYKRFDTTKELEEWLLGRLNEWKTGKWVEELEAKRKRREEERKKLRRRRIFWVIVLAAALICGLSFQMAHQRYVEKKEYSDAIRRIEQLIDEGSTLSLKAALDSISAVAGRFGPGLRDDRTLDSLKCRADSLLGRLGQDTSGGTISGPAIRILPPTARKPANWICIRGEGLPVEFIARITSAALERNTRTPAPEAHDKAGDARFVYTIHESAKDTTRTSGGGYGVWVRYSLSYTDYNSGGKPVGPFDISDGGDDFYAASSAGYKDAIEIIRSEALPHIADIIISNYKP